MEEESKCECMECLTYNPGRECDCLDCIGHDEIRAQVNAHGDDGVITDATGTDAWTVSKDKPKAESKMKFMSMAPAPDVLYHMEKTGDGARWTDMFEGPGSDLYWTHRNKR